MHTHAHAPPPTHTHVHTAAHLLLFTLLLHCKNVTIVTICLLNEHRRNATDSAHCIHNQQHSTPPLPSRLRRDQQKGRVVRVDRRCVHCGGARWQRRQRHTRPDVKHLARPGVCVVEVGEAHDAGDVRLKNQYHTATGGTLLYAGFETCFGWNRQYTAPIGAWSKNTSQIQMLGYIAY